MTSELLVDGDSNAIIAMIKGKDFGFMLKGTLAQWVQYGSSTVAQLIGIHRREGRDLEQIGGQNRVVRW